MLKIIDYNYMYSSNWFKSLLWPLISSWEVVSNSMSSFSCVHHIQKGSHYKAVHILLPELTYPRWYKGLTVVQLLNITPHRVYPDNFYQRQGINLVDLCYSEYGKWTYTSFIGIKFDPDIFPPLLFSLGQYIIKKLNQQLTFPCTISW